MLRAPPRPPGWTFSCPTRPGCDGSDTHLCRAALRDSDGDGLRDNHEVYGVGLWTPAPTPDDPDPEQIEAVGMELGPVWSRSWSGGTSCSRWTFEGTSIRVSPRIRLNQRCQPPTPSQRLTPTVAQITARIWGNVNIINRNGETGIGLHMDVGFPPVVPGDVGKYGDWGGSELRCPEDRRSGLEFFAEERRWLFRYGEYRAAPYTLFGGTSSGPGGASAPSWALVAFAPNALGHELMHTTGLHHYGPRGSDGHNGNFFYLSRVNYLYQAYGWRTPPSTSPLSEIDALSISDGSFGRDFFPDGFNPYAANEECPFGPGRMPGFLADILESGTPEERVTVNRASACWSVDWNRDGVISPASQPVQARGGEIRSAQYERNELSHARAAGSHGGRPRNRRRPGYPGPDQR